MPEVVFKLVALIFESIEGFILYLPACPSCFGYLHNRTFFKFKVRYPVCLKEHFFAFQICLGVTQKVNQYILMRAVQHQTTSTLIHLLGAAIAKGKGGGGLSLFEQLLKLNERIAFFDADDEANISSLQVFNVRSISIEGIFCHCKLTLWQRLSELRKQAFYRS